MLTLQQICQKRKAQIENRNGRAALYERIEQMTQLRDPLRFIAALKLKRLHRSALRSKTYDAYRCK